VLPRGLLVIFAQETDSPNGISGQG